MTLYVYKIIFFLSCKTTYISKKKIKKYKNIFIFKRNVNFNRYLKNRIFFKVFLENL